MPALKIKKFAWLQLRNVVNPVVKRVFKERFTPTGCQELDEIKQRALVNTDISEHLVTLFAEAVAMRPKTIVELGVRGGESTFVLERVAKLFHASLVSVDIKDCLGASPYKDWSFVKKDDIEFAGEFKTFCKERFVTPSIDVLFIDTSHLYEHTCREIESWFPHLSEHAKVIFHDTNIKEVYFKKDHSIAFAWNNQRGVIRAIEKFFNTPMTESRDFVDFRQGWLIRHFAHSNGLTILERIHKKI